MASNILRVTALIEAGLPLPKHETKENVNSHAVSIARLVNTAGGLMTKVWSLLPKIHEKVEEALDKKQKVHSTVMIKVHELYKEILKTLANEDGQTWCFDLDNKIQLSRLRVLTPDQKISMDLGIPVVEAFGTPIESIRSMNGSFVAKKLAVEKRDWEKEQTKEDQAPAQRIDRSVGYGRVMIVG
ncbi:hypothetical protein AJ79_00313 [Helicocarpus griseus UAMH5409]|uniref:Uncharacterized protein n=1 Tax=Helicocarpus griseus UAMH5409 TaxID=1447875 RepID=A0A2B7Y364_9EURO|nr:hypothetical protein AJ79_00313 [Helicocarpus griseus UAMH5409]